MQRIVAKVLGTHGIKGEIKAEILIDDLDLFASFDSVWINNISYKIDSQRLHKGVVLLKLNNLDNLNAVSELKGYIYADFDEELARDQFYVSDLIGLKVFNINKNLEIGRVVNFSNGLQQLLVIELNIDFKPRKQLLVPFVEEYVKKVDTQSKSIFINLTEDLLDIAQ